MTKPPEADVPYTYSELLKDVDSGKPLKLELSRDSEISNAGKAKVYITDEKFNTVDIPVMDAFTQKVMDEQKTNPELQLITKSPSKTNWFFSLIPTIIVMLVSVFLLLFILQQMQGGGGRVMNFGKSKAKVSVDDKNKITFSQVAGLDEEKEELEEIVDFLKNPKKYVDIGARIPKGILLVGPPGTGKTYLAKACSGEAGVPFFSISGSDFVEMFVGVGASRVRDLFEQAKKSTPCIVFIDEIDAVGRRRGAGLGGGHDEREQTLNQLLVEMDGFGVNEGVIIIAATNRPDILDPALLRPGRFDRRVVVGKPDVKGREEVLKVHCKGKVVSSEVDLKVVAQTTSGFTPADLENLMNEAALLAARNNKKEIDMEEMRKAFVKIGIGTEKKSRVISEKERRETAYHEAGHAILFEVLTEMDPTYMISIIPTGLAGGYTMPIPGEDKMFMSKKQMEHDIITFLGGRAAEEIVFQDITSGASNDIMRATGLARAMVTKYGMSDLGPIQFGDDNDEVFIGRDLAHTRNYSESVATKIDNEINKIIDNAYKEALAILRKYEDVLHKISQLLIEKEKVTGEEIRGFFPEGALVNKTRDNKMLSNRSDEEKTSEKSENTDDKEAKEANENNEIEKEDAPWKDWN